MSSSRSHRAPLVGDVAVEAAGSQTFRPALNLSRTGILVASDELPDVGTQVRVVISLPPTGRFVRLQGRVVRHHRAGPVGEVAEQGFAVAFEAVDEAELDAVESYTGTS